MRKKELYVYLLVLMNAALPCLSACSILEKALIARRSRRPQKSNDVDKLFKKRHENKAAIQAMQKEPMPTTEPEVEKFNTRMERLHRQCTSVYYGLEKHRQLSRTEREQKVRWCHRVMDTHRSKVWKNAALAMIARKEGRAAHWIARTLYKYQSKKRWAGTKESPFPLLKRTAAARVAESQRRFQKRRSYAKLNDESCVASKTKFGARAQPANITYYFGPNDDVYVRCYLPQTLGNWLRGKSEATIAGHIWFYTKSRPDGYWYKVPVELGKFYNKDYFDYVFSIREWRKGSPDGALKAQARVTWVRGFASQYDRFRRAVVRRKLYSYQRINLSLTFGP